MREVEARGVDLATGHGEQIWDLNPQLASKSQRAVRRREDIPVGGADARVRRVDPRRGAGAHAIERPQRLHRPSEHRRDVEPRIALALEALRASWDDNPPKGQIVISDGLNAKAIMDEGHLAPYLEEMRRLLADADVPMSKPTSWSPAAGCGSGTGSARRCSKRADPDSFRGILHIIGERPGTMHHAYSVYITVAKGKVWAEKSSTTTSPSS